MALLPDAYSTLDSRLMQRAAVRSAAEHGYDKRSEREQARIADLLRLAPEHADTALDVGAREGFLSRLLARRCPSVTALDLEPPRIDDPSIRCVKGDVCALDFPDNSFDLVLCSEVLEHVSPALLATACAEIARVSKQYVVIGVPYRQDLRIGRTTCYSCGQKNPPWGHVNVFDGSTLNALFSRWLACEKVSFVGENRAATNPISALLLDLAGNPYGTYDQEETCVACRRPLQLPPPRSLGQRVATRAASILNAMQSKLASPRPLWIHARFVKGA